MRFVDPAFLWLALLLPLVFLRRRRDAVPFGPGGFLEPPLPRSWRLRLLPLPAVLAVAGLLFALVALARPVERVAVPREEAGIEIVLCLDTSSSMTARDLDAARTRLDVAKEAAARFIAARGDDRIGLVAFARYPDVRCPPTLDHDALGEFLAAVEPVRGDGPEDATGIGTAVARAAQTLGGDAARVVILFTDGEENVARADTPEEIAPIHAGQLCAELGVRVYSIAAGLGRRRASGEWRALDTEQIERLATGTGGRFFAARDAEGVGAIYREIDALERAAVEEPRYETEERFLPFLAAALALLLAGRFLNTTLLEVLP